MKIDFQQPHQWEELNEKVRQAIELKVGQGRVFWGVNQALSEIAAGLVRQFPHKKKVHFMGSLSPFLEKPMTNLSREGFHVLNTRLSDSLDECLAQTDKDSLFFLYAEDDPLLGRLYPVEGLAKKLHEKQIFSICLSHAAHFYKSRVSELEKFQVRIHSLSSDVALGLLGERAKFAPGVTEGLPWRADKIDEIFNLLKPKKSFAEKIKKFEQQKPGGATPIFTDDHRLFDRATVCWTDMDGSAFIEAFAERRKFQLAAPGVEERIETTSLSRWGGVRTMDWLKSQGLSPEQIRGLVILSHEFIDSTTPEDFNQVRQEILKLQNG